MRGLTSICINPRGQHQQLLLKGKGAAYRVMPRGLSRVGCSRERDPTAYSRCWLLATGGLRGEGELRWFSEH